MKYLLLFFLFPLCAKSQTIPPKANVIIVKNVSFLEMCNSLLDAGYGIEKKDPELQIVQTEPIRYPKYYNGAYKIKIRIKDSTAYVSGIYQCPYETQFTSLLLGTNIQPGKWDNKDRIFHHTNKKGQTLTKSIPGYPFLLMNDFAESLNKTIEYMKEVP